MFSLVATAGTCQVRSSSERMETAFARGCAPFTINISEIDSLGDISRTYTYEKDGVSTSDTFYTYQTPGTFEIIQLLGEDIIPKTDTLVIEVLENQAIDFNVFKCDPTQAMLSFPEPSYDYFQIEVGSRIFQSDSTSDFRNLVSFQNSLQLNIQGFYTNAAPNCQMIDTLITRTDTGPIIQPSVDYDFVCSNNFLANISFEGNEDQLYQLSFSDENGAAIRTDFISGSSKSITIDSIKVNEDTEQLCLIIDAISGCDSTVFETRELCYPTDLLNTPVAYAFASFNGDSIDIHLDQGAISNLSLTSQTEDGNSIIHKINDNLITLPYISNTPPAYTISFNSECPQDSISYNIAPPFVKANRIGINHYTITYSPSEFLFLENRNSTMESLLIGNSDTNVFSNTNDELRLSLAMGNNQQLLSIETIDSIKLFSNTKTLAYEFYVYIPEAFTPNNDGVNDRLELYGLPTEKFTFKVFNRWGEKVFQTSDQNEFWNGRLVNGHIVEGTYVYRLNFYNSLGEIFTQQGSFALIRD